MPSSSPPRFGKHGKIGYVPALTESKTVSNTYRDFGYEMLLQSAESTWERAVTNWVGRGIQVDSSSHNLIGRRHRTLTPNLRLVSRKRRERVRVNVAPRFQAAGERFIQPRLTDEFDLRARFGFLDPLIWGEVEQRYFRNTFEASVPLFAPDLNALLSVGRAS